MRRRERFGFVRFKVWIKRRVSVDLPFDVFGNGHKRHKAVEL